MHPRKDRQQGRVLVVDDMPSTRGLLKDMLEGLGFGHVAEARNGEEALTSLREDTPDLIISDQVMDGMTGTELVEVLRGHPEFSDIPFIMVSAVRDAPSIDSALDLGVDDYLAKPISMGLLDRKIDDVFRRRLTML
jgi:PleD family two-component response regulator